MRALLFGFLAIAFATPTAATCVRPDVEPARLALQAALPKEDMVTIVSPRERAAIATMKTKLKAYVAATVACASDPKTIENMLAEGAPLLDFHVRELRPGTIGVIANFGIQCAGDTTLTLFDRKDGAWRQVMHLEAPPYKRIDGAWDMFGYELSPPDKTGHRFVVTRTVAPWCSSEWSTIRYVLWRPGRATPEFQGGDSIWWGGEDLGRLKLGVSDFELRFHGASIDGGRHNREWVRHFSVDGGKVVRIAPFANSPMDFVEEWIQSAWADARDWTVPALAPRVEDVHAKFHAKPYGEYRSVRRCGSDVMQIEIEPSEADGSLFFQVAGTKDFRLAGLANAADPHCAGKNLFDPGKPNWP